MSSFFFFILYFIATILSDKSCQKHGVLKKYKKGRWPYRGVFIEGDDSNLLHNDIERLKGGTLEL